MSEQKLKIKAATAQEICAGFELSATGAGHLAEGMAPLAFLDALVKAGDFPDATHFLARALPKREAVWWACTCVRDGLGERPAAPRLAAIQMAETWVYRPTEENRRKAEQAGRAVEDGHAARWAALAAFWSGGSVSPPGLPDVPAAPDATAKAVAGAVLTAAAAEPEVLKPAAAEARWRRFFAAGRDIALGGTGRPAAAATPR